MPLGYKKGLKVASQMEDCLKQQLRLYLQSWDVVHIGIATQLSLEEL